MADKIFFGSVKEFQNDYWTMYNIWITQDDINKLQYNDRGWANVSLKKWKSWKWYIEVHTPKEKQETFDDSNDEEIPF